MNTRTTIWMATLCLAFAGLSVAGEARADDGLTIVRDGATDYAIVLDADASPSEQWAARELADHLKQMSGAELPIQAAPSAVPDKAIVIGFGPAAESLGARADDSLGTDGFIIKPVGSRLVIAGGEKRGSLYGVYTLLESLGVRWWYPGQTFVPKSRTVTVSAAEKREMPSLEYRDMMFNENYSPAGHLWMARNKVNGMTWESLEEWIASRDDPAAAAKPLGYLGEHPEALGGRYKFVGNLVHSYDILLKLSGHEVTDDMRALVNDKRSTGQPCLSNPKTLAAMVDGVIKAYAETPDARFVVVGQMDNSNYCRCPDCAAIDEAEGSHAGQVIRFANRVAEEVEKRRPGSCITTAAYEWSRKPPRNLKPRDNVFITLCSIECDFSHPLADGSNPENKAFKEDIEGWSKIARKLYIWHYVGNRDHYLLPNPEIETLAPNMKFFADHHAAGVFNQGTHQGTATDLSPMKMWILARAMWNTDLDGRALIEEFCRGFYGPAGDDVLKYVDIMHRTAHERDYHLGRRVDLNAPFLKPEIIAEAEETLRKAAAVADQPEFARRVRQAHMGIWYVLAKRGPGSPTWIAVEKRVGPLDLTQISDNLAAVCKDWGIAKIDDPDPIQPWLDWLKGYAAAVKDKGRPVPPELADADPASYRLIQACQMDGMPKWWQPTAGASDGWAVRVPSPGWHTKYALNTPEDYTPGKKYILYVRARGELSPEADGEPWEFGVYPKGNTVRVGLDPLRDGQWHVFELGPWEPAEGQFFWTAMRRVAGQNAVAIDCLWLKEAP